MSINGFVFFLGWGLVGLSGLIWSLINLWLSLRCKFWKIVDGEIKDSCTDARRSGRSLFKSYYPIISYTYNVNGVAFEGNRIRYGSTGGSKSEAHDYFEKYPAGKKVKISIDPNNYGRSVLEPGPSWGIFGAIILFLAAGAWGLTGVLDYLQANH